MSHALSSTPGPARHRPYFTDRADAGRALARMAQDADIGPLVVIGIARGGVPVAAEVARALHAPLDVMVVRKVGHPWQPELALGAVTSNGVFTPSGVHAPEVSADELEHLIATAVAASQEMETQLHSDHSWMRGASVMVVDDGVATGASLHAAVRAVRTRGATWIIAATPVASPAAIKLLSRSADQVLCVVTDEHLLAVGQAYQDFAPVSIDAVTSLVSPDTAYATAPGVQA